MNRSQKQLHSLLQKQEHSHEDSRQIVAIIQEAAYDMPDCLFQHSYNAYRRDPHSDQKYKQLQSLIYSGLEMNIPLSFLRKCLLKLRKSIGDNIYTLRLRRFTNYIKSSQSSEQLSFGQLLSHDLTDNQTRKKILTIYKRKNKIPEFIEHMNRYLENEPMDEEAWIELGELYCERSNFMKAIFCYEQLLILSPNNDDYTLRLVQLYLTQNNKGVVDKAIKYLSYLITKRPDNLRALWILYRACSMIKGEQYSELQETCSEAINKLYSRKNPAIKISEAL